MDEKPEHYFEDDEQFREWLGENHDTSDGVFLIFYKVDSGIPSMRWEEAVRVALCYGWIDSTVKKLSDVKRRQYFCPRRPKSVWSKVNKTHIEELIELELMRAPGLAAIEVAKANGSWSALDDVENGVVPEDLKAAFDEALEAFENFNGFTKGQRKSYLYWLQQAKRQSTRDKRIVEIIACCEKNQKYRT